MNRSITTRRRALQAMGASLVGSLSGCGQSNLNTIVVSKRDDEVSDGVVHLHANEDYFDLETFAEFQAETGLEVKYFLYEEGEELEAMLRSQVDQVDVVLTDTYNLAKLIHLSYLRPLTHQKLPNLSGILPEYLNRDSDPDNRYSAPYMSGMSVLAYRKDKFTPQSRSWKALWDPAVAGHVLLPREGVDPVICSLLANGLRVDSERPEDYEIAKNSLKELLVENKARCVDVLDIREALISGDAWAAILYNGDAASADEKCSEVDYFIPDEGSALWLDSFAIARDSRRKDAAHRFIDFMCRPEIAAKNSLYTLYATPVKGARCSLPPEFVGNTRLFPSTKMLQTLPWLPGVTRTRESLLSEAWHPIRTAIRETVESEGAAEIKP
jgi:spermidine/putrescine-binding protein